MTLAEKLEVFRGCRGIGFEPQFSTFKFGFYAGAAAALDSASDALLAGTLKESCLKMLDECEQAVNERLNRSDAREKQK